MSKNVYLILPAILICLMVGLLPTLASINYSVQVPFAAVSNSWKALENFRHIFSDSRFIDAFGRNLLYSIICLAIEIPAGIGLALLVYKKGLLNSVVSAIIVIPALLPPITVGLIWRLMLKQAGPITATILKIAPFLNWNPFIDPTQAFVSIVVMDVWHWTSLVTLVVSAGLAGMDRSPELSAKTEGATRFQIFRYIELPAIGFSISFVTLLRLIDSLKVYDEIVILTSGGPGLTTEMLSVYVKKLAIDQWNVGYGAAVSLIYNLLTLVLVNVLLNSMTRGKGLKV